MYISNTILMRGFSLCLGACKESTEINHGNSGAQDNTLFLYLAQGSGRANGADLVIGINDMTSHKHEPIAYTAGPEGAMWAALNVDLNKKHAYQVLDSGVVTITANNASERHFFATIAGGISVNGKPLAEHKFARVWPLKEYHLEVPQGSVAVLLSIGA
jgi:hypothetical protein